MALEAMLNKAGVAAFFTVRCAAAVARLGLKLLLTLAPSSPLPLFFLLRRVTFTLVAAARVRARAPRAPLRAAPPSHPFSLLCHHPHTHAPPAGLRALYACGGR